MKLKFLFVAIISLLIESFSFGQNDRIPISVNTLIGDTLSLEERNYFSLFPQIEGYRWAMFYLNSDSTVDAKITYLRNSLQLDTIICGYSTLASLEYNMSIKSNSEFDEGAELTVYDSLGEEITGELLSVRPNSIILLKSGCGKDLRNLDCAWQVRYSHIDKLVIKGNSNLWLGAGLGILASMVTGVFICKNNYHDPETGFFKDAVKYGSIIDIIPKILISSFALTSLGAIIGLMTSESDEIIDSFNEDDIKGLSAYSRYPFEEPDELKKLE